MSMDESFGWSDWMIALLDEADAATVWSTLKISIQRGVPDSVRKALWLKANDADSFSVKHPNFYNAIMRNTFGTKAPDHSSSRCPTFSGGMLGLQEDVEGAEIDVDEWEVDLDVLATPRLSISSRVLNISDSAADLLQTWFSGTPKSSPSLSSGKSYDGPEKVEMYHIGREIVKESREQKGYTPHPAVVSLGRNLPPEHNFWLPPAVTEPCDVDAESSVGVINDEETGIFSDVPTKFDAPSLVHMDTHEWHDFRTYMKSTHMQRMRQSQRMANARQQWREKLRDDSFTSSEEDYGIPKFASDLYPSAMDSGQLRVRSSSVSVGSIHEGYLYTSEPQSISKKNPPTVNVPSRASSQHIPFFLHPKKEIEAPEDTRETLWENPTLSSTSLSSEYNSAKYASAVTPANQTFKKNANPVTSRSNKHPSTKKGSFLDRVKQSLQFGKINSNSVKENPQVEVATGILSYGKGETVGAVSHSSSFHLGNGNSSDDAISLDNCQLTHGTTDVLRPKLQEPEEEERKDIQPFSLLTDYIADSSRGIVSQNTPSTGLISDGMIEGMGNSENVSNVPAREEENDQVEQTEKKENLLNPHTAPPLLFTTLKEKNIEMSLFSTRPDIQSLENVTEFAALLTENGRCVVRNVLWCLNSLHTSEFEFCPIIPHLACLLALTMNAQEILCVLHNVIKRAIRSCTSDFKRPYLTYTRSDFVRFVKLVMGAIRRHQTKVFNHLRSLNVDLAAWVSRAIQDGFAKMLSFDYVLRIYGAFLFEGCKVFYRYCLATLKFLKQDLLKCTTLNEAEELLYHIPSNSALQTIDLTKMAYKMRIRSRAGALAALSTDSPSPYLLAVQMIE
ncbi:TLD protein [Cardiosporidium cionae]|uniref:TLD protein n=1 Tax=Cardiosporidium cionae TaxID=476202 RepID=A0ABQ7J6W7_9APIC|nr:TLD protein [Cardiosporidium cionae]|eukprot:KAF8819720.1 TLD protein [Cardiosporidium cionae]